MQQALREIRELIGRGEVRQALVHLNRQGEHRFTAMYRFDDATLHNLVFHDRDNPEETRTDDIPVLASYCVFVRDSGAGFTTEDAPTDGRLAGHPKRQQVRSYCGVPILDEAGRMLGTLCQFDVAAVPFPPQQVALLEAVAAALQHRPG